MFKLYFCKNNVKLKLKKRGPLIETSITKLKEENAEIFQTQHLLHC